MVRKRPTYVMEFQTISLRLPTGKFVCDCCEVERGEKHQHFCYWRKSKRGGR